jgi:phospholipid/cholesterol/gamma-HCH transport system substrate-binding protein
MIELEIKPTRAANMRSTAVIGVALLIAGALMFLLSGAGAGLFETKATLSTYMPDATGLGPKSQVRLGGLVIGKVKQVEVTRYLDPGRAVRVDMAVSSRYLPMIPVDSQTSIGADTAVGFKFVAIGRGKSDGIVADRAFIASEPLQQADERADMVKSLQDKLKDVDTMLSVVAAPDSKFGHYIFGDTEYRNLMVGTKAFSTAAREFVDPNGWAGSAIFRTGAYDQALAKVADTEKAMDAIAKGEGSAGKFYADDKAFDELVAQLHALRLTLGDLNAGKGSAGDLLTTDAAHKKIVDLLQATDKMLAPLDAKDGAIAELLRDPKLYRSLQASLGSLEKLLNDFHTNPGKYTKRKIKF